MKGLITRPDALLLLLGASLLPIYIFHSGGVQPTHMVLACFAGLVLVTRRIPLTFWSLSLLAVFLDSFAVESFYVIRGGNPEVLINSIFFLYNFLLVCAVYVYVQKDGLSALTLGIIIAAAVALITMLITGVDLRVMGEGGRATSTFNNPNQLGYFSVCLLSLAYLFYRQGTINYWIALGIFGVSVFLAIISLSKAAMIANFLVIIVALKPTSSRSSLVVWCIGAVAGVGILFLLYTNGAFDGYLFTQRLTNIANERDSSLEARGYFAIVEGSTPQILLGLGSQGVDDIVGHEVHSTLGSMINDYGLFGLLLFSCALGVWAVRLWQGYEFAGLVCIAGPAMLYGITHNGVRFTIFWLLFAASMAIAQNRITEKRRRKISSSRDANFARSNLSEAPHVGGGIVRDEPKAY